MATISYFHYTGTPFRVEVRVEGKRTGDIKRDAGGYYYRAKAGNEGDRFETVEAVKASLEGND